MWRNMTQNETKCTKQINVFEGKKKKKETGRMERMEKDKFTLFSLQMIRCATQLAESIERK